MRQEQRIGNELGSSKWLVCDAQRSPPLRICVFWYQASFVYWITTYRHNRAVSFGPTYFPISLSNCSLVFQGRYSLNSRTMRAPALGMLRMSSSVAVLSLTGMNTYCLS